MAGCKNPECKNGVTPGVIGIGRGKTGPPLIGADGKMSIPMRWAWVSCRACNPDEKAPYVHTRRTTEEIQERARLADAKAPYVQQDPRLARLAKSVPRLPASAPPPDNSAAISKLSDQIADLSSQLAKSLAQNVELTGTVGKLSGQVAELLAENARLRTAPQEPISPPPPSLPSGKAPKGRKSRQIAKPS